MSKSEELTLEEQVERIRRKRPNTCQTDSKHRLPAFGSCRPCGLFLERCQSYIRTGDNRSWHVTEDCGILYSFCTIEEK